MRGHNQKRCFKILATIVMCMCFCICFAGNTYASSNQDVKVSVIVPVYKVEQWLYECLDSLVNQTLKEIEIICIDDGSPDNCGKILDEYAKADDRIIVVHQENQGISCARNVGMDLAKGEYLTFVDSDDYIDIHTYEYTYNIAHENCDDVLEFGVITFPNNTHFEITTYNREIEIKEPKDARALTENQYVWNKLYKTSMMKDSDVKFIPKMIYEDIAFTQMIIPHIKRYHSIEEKFYYYRQREGSITHVGIAHKDLSNCINAIFPVCQEWRNQNMLEGNEDYILSLLLEKYYWALEPSIKKNPKLARQILDAFGDDIHNDRVLVKCSRYIKYLVRKMERC